MDEKRFAIFYNETYEPYFIAHDLTWEKLLKFFKENVSYPLDDLEVYRTDGIPDIFEIYKEGKDLEDED